MKRFDVCLVVLFVVLVEILLVEGQFTCFRKFRSKKNKEFCKGPVRKKNKYPTAEKCCKKKGQGFASGLVKVGKNKFACTSCSSFSSNQQPTTTTERPDWGNWSPCSTTCGAGWRSRYRMCDDCDKNHFENVQSEPCMLNFYCAVDGNWGPWFAWTACTASCGGGTRSRTRRCNYPPPTSGGKNCPGDAEKEESCNEDPCPVHGNWGPWSRYSLCSATCGSGTMVRTRECDSPKPQYGGRLCRGNGVNIQRCKNKECPLHGGWSLWGSWSDCSVTCDTGIVVRTRACDSPRPLFGGRQCEGSSRDTRECDANRNCPVHGGWTTWTNYGRCNAPRCASGTQTRTRSCTDPRPRNGGRFCFGKSYETSECVNDENCPSQGEWCAWNEWSQCTATCTGLNSMQVRQRSCRCPAPKSGGSECLGKTFEVRDCENVPPCNPYGDFISKRVEVSDSDNSEGGTFYSSKVDGSGDDSNNGDQEEDKESTTGKQSQ